MDPVRAVQGGASFHVRCCAGGEAALALHEGLDKGGQVPQGARQDPDHRVMPDSEDARKAHKPPACPEPRALITPPTGTRSSGDTRAHAPPRVGDSPPELRRRRRVDRPGARGGLSCARRGTPRSSTPSSRTSSSTCPCPTTPPCRHARGGKGAEKHPHILATAPLFELVLSHIEAQQPEARASQPDTDPS